MSKTDNKMKGMTRADLMDIIYQLQIENQELKNKCESAEAKLEDKNLQITNAGSIAEAVLKINNIFGSAQLAADQYLEQVKKSHEGSERKSNMIVEDANKEAERIIGEANKKAAKILSEADEESDRKWRALQRKTEDFLKTRSELMNLLKK